MSLTAAEHHKIYGSVTDEQLEDLFGVAELWLDASLVVPGYIDEAKAQFPEEDFLQAHQQALLELAKRLRGPNKNALARILADLQTVIDSQSCATGYGREELDKALALLANA